MREYSKKKKKKKIMYKRNGEHLPEITLLEHEAESNYKWIFCA